MWPFSRKSRQTKETKVNIYQMQAAKTTPQNYYSLAKEGYSLNPYMFACNKKISDAMKNITWDVYQKTSDGKSKKIENHPFLKLLEKPNPQYTFSIMQDAFVSYYNFDGNIFIEKVKDSQGKTIEIYVHRPDFIEIQFNTYDTINPIKQYQYNNGRIVNWQPDEMLHVKSFNPLDDTPLFGRGIPIVAAGSMSGDQNNESRRWNLRLLQNGAVPSGVVTTRDDVEELSEPTIKLIQDQFMERFTGSKNAGKPLILQNAQWTGAGFNSRDLDWNAGMQQSAREICETMGVPSLLVGDPSAKTYSNYKEAKKALYVDTVIPLNKKIMQEFTQKLLQVEYGEQFYLKQDLSTIEVLKEERATLWSNVASSKFLTENEKREALGYPREEGLDIYRVDGNTVNEEMGNPLIGYGEDEI